MAIDNFSNVRGMDAPCQYLRRSSVSQSVVIGFSVSRRPMESTLRLLEENEKLSNEYKLAQLKLDRKAEALLIISQELASCQDERDNLQRKCAELVLKCREQRRLLKAQKIREQQAEQTSRKDQADILQTLNRVNEENRALSAEIEHLNAELAEAQGDAKCLRQKLASLETAKNEKEKYNQSVCACSEAEMLKNLEILTTKNSQLTKDLKMVLCEKEELTIERDGYQSKFNKVNQELYALLNGSGNNIPDVEDLLSENRFLKQQVESLKEENLTSQTILSKYKAIHKAIEKRKGVVMKFGLSTGGDSSSNDKAGVALLTTPTVKQATVANSNDVPLYTIKQIVQAIEKDRNTNCLNLDYRQISHMLLDAINDKTVAVMHLRKANKILAERLHHVESKYSKNGNNKIIGIISGQRLPVMIDHSWINACLYENVKPILVNLKQISILLENSSPNV
ncbi:Coiled-coil domain-containing protein [Trichinella pseudospiralis]|uniref:Coiled-coil domain-containing protein n=1 Tax=Trichinella pseudospiralis TaxID=6337 RepID=A0A0V0YIK1_TRIPS|nr:Coiled-coil domain-containing protein [Trichinella pseudospiralis]